MSYYSNGCNQQLSIARISQIVFGTHRHPSFGKSLLCLREMQSNFVSIEVSIVRSAKTSIQSKGTAGYNYGCETHDGMFFRRRLMV